MKKFFVIAIMFFILFISFPAVGISEYNGEDINSSEYQVIPDEAIRLRILANSDSLQDQQLKRTIRDQVNKEITKWVEEIGSIEEARHLIQERLGKIDEIVAQVLKATGADQSYQVEYGENVQFPTKVYGNFVYPAGDYEAILVTLGEGKGANWWCVLFPPLCFLDFSNGTSVAAEDGQQQEESQEDKAEQQENENEVEVKFFLVDWFAKWFG